MRLSRYIKKNDLSFAKFADLIEVEPRSVARYAQGTRIPAPKVMEAIYTATEGVVTPNDFHDLPDLRQ